MQKLLISLTICATMLFVGCSAHRIEIQQGNVIEQNMIDELKVGMDKRQVSYIMGTPMLQDPFHQSRWDYVYFRVSEKQEKTLYRVELIFDGDKLAKINSIGGPFPEGRKIR